MGEKGVYPGLWETENQRCAAWRSRSYLEEESQQLESPRHRSSVERRLGRWMAGEMRFRKHRAVQFEQIDITGEFSLSSRLFSLLHGAFVLPQAPPRDRIFLHHQAIKIIITMGISKACIVLLLIIGAAGESAV